MATYICESNTNFTSSLKLIDSATLELSEASSVSVSSVFVAGTAFTPGAITIEGIIIRFRGVSTNSGNFFVELYNSTAGATVSGTQVQVAMNDLNTAFPNIGSTNVIGGCAYFKFGSPVTLLAATNYQVRVKANTLIYVNVVSGSNISKALVLSTSGTMSTNDDLYVLAPFTNTSTPSVITCTMNNTASTVFGSIELGAFGKMVLENNASTAYQLKIGDAKFFKSYANSVTEFGNSSTRVNSTSSFLLELQATSAASNGIKIRNPAIFKAYGATKTRLAKLAANAANGATSLTTDISTGWKNGDIIGIGNTTRASNLSDKKALTADASGTTLTITAITGAKSGTAPVQADLGNCTSNVQIYGTSTTSTYYISLNEVTLSYGGTLELDQVECRYIGSGTSMKHGVSFAGSTYTVNIINSAFHDAHASARLIFPSSNNNWTTFTVTGCVFYGGSYALDSISATANLNVSAKFNNNLCINQASSAIYIGRGTAWNQLSNSCEVKSNICTGAPGYGISLSLSDCDIYMNLTDNVVYGCQTGGILFNPIKNSKVGKFISYRNAQYGLSLATCKNLLIDELVMFGNASRNLIINNSGFSNIVIKTCDLQAGTGETSPVGIYIDGPMKSIVLQNFSIGTVTPHTTCDISVNSLFAGEFILVNGTLGSTTKISGISNLDKWSFIKIQKSGGTSGQDFAYGQYGTISNDSTIYDSSPRSLRLTPSSATYSQFAPIFSCNIPSGQTATLSVKVRKSVVGDGAAYNGIQPNIWMRSNAAAGSSFNTDVLMATATNAANGAWETLTFTTPTASDNTAVSFYIEASGSAGWVNVDSVRAS